MTFASSRRISSSYSSSSPLLAVAVMVVFVIFMSQIWVCSNCKAEAIRIFPENGMPKLKKEKNITVDKATKEDDLFHKFFNGKKGYTFNPTQKGLESNKRRVPSCPDPLHN